MPAIACKADIARPNTLAECGLVDGQATKGRHSICAVQGLHKSRLAVVIDGNGDARKVACTWRGARTALYPNRHIPVRLGVMPLFQV